MVGAPNSPGCQAVYTYMGNDTHDSNHTLLLIRLPINLLYRGQQPATLPVIEHIPEPGLCLPLVLPTLNLRPRGPSPPLRPLPAVENYVVPILHARAAPPTACVSLAYQFPPVPDLPLTRPRMCVVRYGPPPPFYCPAQPETLTLPLSSSCLLPESPNTAFGNRPLLGKVRVLPRSLVSFFVPHHTRMPFHPAYFHGSFPPPMDPVHHSRYRIRQALC